MVFRDYWRVLSRPGSRFGDWINEVRWKFKGQWKVGEDALQNEYYLYQGRADVPIVRKVRYHRDVDKNPTKVPFLWAQWLRYIRDCPPTNRELNIVSHAQEKQSKRNASWLETDMKEREKELSLGMHRDQRQTELSYFELMTKYQDEQNVKSKEKEQKMHEDFEKQKAEKPKPEPSGEFYDFKPGVWRPGMKRATEIEEKEEEFEEIRETWKPMRRKRKIVKEDEDVGVRIGIPVRQSTPTRARSMNPGKIDYEADNVDEYDRT